MPRYFFNTRIGDELISDPDGEVLRDPDRAWEMARAMIRELLEDRGRRRRAVECAVIEVTDDEGEIVLEFPFAEAILDAPGQAGDEALTRREARPAQHRRRRIYSGHVCRLQICGQMSEIADSGKPPAPASSCRREEMRLPSGRTT